MEQMKQIAKRRFLMLIPIAAFVAGCGGSSATSASNTGGTGGGGGTVAPAAQTTATFNVDVATGKVTITPSVATSAAKSGALSPQAVFLGDSIGFNSSDLLNEAGSVSGQRTMSVTLTNNFGLPLGTDPSGTTNGLKVVLSPVTNLTSPPNIESLSNVSTFAGSGSTGNTNGGALSATFTSPQGVAINSQNAIFVADAGGRIREIQSGAVTTLAGGGTASNPDGLGASAYFGAPVGIAVNPADGSLIVCDQTLNKIRHITPAGLVSTIAGTGAAGGNNGTGTVATFSSPTGVAIDTSGNIYISETTGSRIRKMVFVGGDPTQAANYSVSTLSGTGVIGGADGPSAVATFHAPYQLALDGNGGLYVADAGNNKIRRVDVNSGAVTTVAGTGAGSDVDGNGFAATFNGPRGVTWANGALFVTENGGDVVRQISLTQGASPSAAANWTVQTLAGTALVPGSVNGVGSNALFNGMVMLAASSGGSLFVADSGNHLVRRVTPATGNFPVGVTTGSASTTPVLFANPDGTEAGNATGTNLPYLIYTGALGAGATSPPRYWDFDVPNGVTAFTFTVTVVAATPVPAQLDSVNNAPGGGAGSPHVYVRTIAGLFGTSGYFDGPAPGATFYGYGFSATDAAGDIFVADEDNEVIRRISANGVVTTIAGTFFTQPPTIQDGPGTTASFQHPSGIAAAPDGKTLFVCDYEACAIRCLTLVGSDPSLAVNWKVTTIIGTPEVSGFALNTYGNLCSITAPGGIAYNPNTHILYFTEYGGNRVDEAELIGSDPTQAANWAVSLLAGSLNGAIGTPGSTNGIGANATFDEPWGITYDSAGNVYVADEANDEIRKVTPTGQASTLAGSSSSLGDVDGQGASAKFTGPTGIAIDPAGNVYVSDQSNHIREVSPSGLVTTVAGTGGSGHADGPGNTAQLQPFGLSIQADGTLIVGETTDFRAISRSYSNSTVGP